MDEERDLSPSLSLSLSSFRPLVCPFFCFSSAQEEKKGRFDWTQQRSKSTSCQPFCRYPTCKIGTIPLGCTARSTSASAGDPDGPATAPATGADASPFVDMPTAKQRCNKTIRSKLALYRSQCGGYTLGAKVA